MQNKIRLFLCSQELAAWISDLNVLALKSFSQMS